MNPHPHPLPPRSYLLVQWEPGRVTTEATAPWTPYFPTDVRLLRTAHQQADLLPTSATRASGPTDLQTPEEAAT